MESTSAPQVTTGTTRHAVIPLLRPVDVPTEKLTVGPRPAAPLQRLTARPLTARFDRAAYDASYDRFQHAADRAFGDGPDGGAA